MKPVVRWALTAVAAAAAAVPGLCSSLPADQARILEDVRAYAVDSSARLPNFICTQVTKRDSARANTRQTEDSGLTGPYYGQSDEIVEQITYFNQQEKYELVSINGRKAAGESRGAMAGALSGGEFGSALRVLFVPQTQTEFRWHGTGKVRGREAFVFSYKVPREAGMLVTARNAGKEERVAYEGEIFAAKDTKEVLRMTSKFKMPSGFPIESAWRVVEFGPVSIAGRSYNLPLHAELTMQSGPDTFVNKIEFRNYHEFAVQSTIRFGELAGGAPVQSELSAPGASTQAASADAAVPSQVVAAASAGPAEAAVPPALALPSSQPAPERPAAVAPSVHDAAPPSAAVAPAPQVGKNVPFNLQLSADLVLVPVVVRDAAGHPLAGLTREDFELSDRGKRQQIASVTAETSGCGRAPDGAGAEQHYTVFLFDDIHLDFEELVRSRDAVRGQVERMGAHEQAAVLTTSGLLQSPMTADRAKLNEVLEKLKARPLGDATAQKCPAINYTIADRLVNQGSNPDLQDAVDHETIKCLGLPADDQHIAASMRVAQGMVRQVAATVERVEEQRSRQALLQLRDVAKWLSKAPGERTLVLLTPGFVIGRAASFDSSDTIEETVRGGIAVDVLDTRGVAVWNPGGTDGNEARDMVFARMKSSFEQEEAASSMAAMGALADGTGGVMVRNSNDLIGGLDRLVSERRCAYVLGFRPDGSKMDGSFHALEVKVKGQDKTTVQARRGYFAVQRPHSQKD